MFSLLQYAEAEKQTGNGALGCACSSVLAYHSGGAIPVTAFQPLRYWLFAPVFQWHFRGKWPILTGVATLLLRWQGPSTQRWPLS